jgi:hypothetical protein
MNEQMKKGLFVLLAGIAVVAIPTIMRAHGGNNDPAVVHACVNNASKSVRIVGVDGVCTNAESPMHWAIQGSNGTNGTNGIDGTSVTFVDYFGGNAHGCLNGGAIYAAGNPPVNTYVCNGVNGTSAGHADGPCFDDTNRYVNCNDGTETDTLTGLIWLQQANCRARVNWAAANQAAAALKSGDCGLTDGSSPGDWRLPTKAEWETTMAKAIAIGCKSGGPGGPPTLTNDRGIGCYSSGLFSSFTGVLASTLIEGYWSSTADEDSPDEAWFTSLFYAFGIFTNKDIGGFVWPVRGGSR